MFKIATTLEVLPLLPPRRSSGAADSKGDDEQQRMDAEGVGGMEEEEDEGIRREAMYERDELQRQIWDSLDSFSTEPPFTIQRLAELVVDPRRHYRSALKYLRAVQRTLQVSSGMSSYIADTYSLSPGPAEASILGQASTLDMDGTSPLLRSSPSPHAPPLLSPIPWMINNNSSKGSEEDGDDLHKDAEMEAASGETHTVVVVPTGGSPTHVHHPAVNGHDASLAEGGSPSLPTASPTGGRVDELDPLPPSLTSPPAAGMTEAPLPITDPQGSPPRSHYSPDHAAAGSPPRALESPRRPSF